MIVVKNLTKVYKTRRREVRALNNISFTLPDTGMVFIVGKSGSGKSTLLNMISGLDKFTSGKIIAGGNSVEHMNSKTKERYLSSYIGYIFQDYRLIEDFTVKQNVELAADISGSKKDVEKYLKAVGLEGYENRLPKELSGGQKQRVSIARALIKSPKVILADEPTGNLDKETTTDVLRLLKQVSKDTLVIIVSHNLRDADTYADRIIELSDGNVIHDKSRIENYDNKFKYQDGVINLPHHKDLTNVELGELLRRGRRSSSIVQKKEGFAPTENQEERKEKVKLHNKGMSFKNRFKMFSIFFKRKIFSKLTTVVLAAVILSVFYVIQSLTLFDMSTAIMNAVSANNDYGVIIQAGTSSYSTAKTVGRMPESKIQKVIDAYDGNVYRLYSEYMYTNTKGGGESYITSEQNFITFYSRITAGTLNTTEEYAARLLSVDKLNVLAGDLYKEDFGVVITDYVADSIIHHYENEESTFILDDDGNKLSTEEIYEKLIGERIVVTEKTYINAIVDTDYEERYREIKNTLDQLSIDTNLDNLATDPLYIEFKSDMSERYNLAFSFNPNYYEALCDYMVGFDKEIAEEKGITDKSSAMRFSATCNVVKSVTVSPIVTIDKTNKYNLGNGEMAISYSLYNTIYGTSLKSADVKEFNETFAPKPVTFTQNESSAVKELYNSESYTIKEVTSSSNVYVNEATYRELMKFNTYTYSLYLDDAEAAVDLADLLTETKLSVCSGKVSNVYYIRRSINIFEKFFTITMVMILVACMAFLVSFGIKSIRSNIYEIGVIKAMGGIKKDISKIFISQSLIIGIGILISTYIGMQVGAFVANEIFLASLEAVMGDQIRGVTAIDFYPLWAIVDIFISLIVVVVSAVISTVSIDRLNLLSILKAKE